MLLASLLAARPAHAYSVLAHEALVDAEWDAGIRPLLVARFPRATAADLADARGYAYGGSVIQDLGYYPFGVKFFSDLLHYVRSGDFVERMVADARTLDEYAFALGALAHYEADRTGHPEAINVALPIIFPKLKREFGDRVTYVQAPKEHVIVEFSFDVVETAAGKYGPEAYSRFLGFQVCDDLLARAFKEVYGLDMKEVLPDTGLSFGTYRFSVSQLIPAITKAAWRDQHEAIEKLVPGVERKSFVFSFPRKQYERTYGSHFTRPNWFARFLGFLYRLLPKIGPLKPLSFQTPTPHAETLFVDSLRDARARYRHSLEEVRGGTLKLRNTDFDTGQPTRHGEYALADDTYAKLTERLATKKFRTAPRAMVADLLDFYQDAKLPSGKGKEERTHWKDLQRALGTLASIRQNAERR